MGSTDHLRETQANYKREKMLKTTASQGNSEISFHIFHLASSVKLVMPSTSSAGRRENCRIIRKSMWPRLDNFQMNTQTRPAAEMLAEMHTGMLVAPLVRNHDKRESPTAYHTKTENTGDGP